MLLNVTKTGQAHALLHVAKTGEAHPWLRKFRLLGSIVLVRTLGGVDIDHRQRVRMSEVGSYADRVELIADPLRGGLISAHQCICCFSMQIIIIIIKRRSGINPIPPTVIDRD